MAGLQRRQAIAVILLRIIVVADPNEGGLEKMNDGGKDFLSREASKGHVLANLRADGRKSLGELHHMFHIWCFRGPLETLMVAILLASLGIATRRLDVTVRRRADPDVCPGGDGERLDAPEDVHLGQPGTIRMGVGEALP
jgi:hypothetical protein